MKNYEVYSRNFSQVIQDHDIMCAIAQFNDDNPNEEVITVENIEARNESPSPLSGEEIKPFDSAGVEAGESIKLISALLSGKVLERNHGEKGSWWYENRQHISTLSSYAYNDKRYFEVKGWGSAFGQAEDRVVELITHPKEWSIAPNSEQEAQASVASKDDSSTSDDTKNNSSNSGERQQLTGEAIEALKLCQPYMEDLQFENHNEPSAGISYDYKLDKAIRALYKCLGIEAHASQPPTPEAGNVVTGDDLNWYHIGWNEKSRHIREYGSLICSNCYSPNNINFKATKEEFEKLKQFWLEKVEPGQQTSNQRIVEGL